MNSPKWYKVAGTATWLLAMILLAGLAFQIYRLVVQPIHSTDFRYVWLAGDMWKEGLNPYSATYTSRSEALFGNENSLSAWVYPFQWYLVAVPLSYLDLPVSLAIWQISSVILAVCAFVLSLMSARINGARITREIALGLAIIAATFTPLSAVLQLGQPVILPTFGFALLLYGSVKERFVLEILGVLLLALKPQFGLPVMFMLAGTRRGLALCIIGGLATMILAVPTLLFVDAGSQVLGLIANITGGYDAVAVNQPVSMIGLPSLVVRSTGIGMPISAGLLVACVASFLMSMMLQISNVFNRSDKLTFGFGFSAICVSLLVGVHPSDLAILVIYLPFVIMQRIPYRLISLVGFLVLWRFENISRLFDFHVSAPSIAIASVGVLFIGTGWALDFLYKARENIIRRNQPSTF